MPSEVSCGCRYFQSVTESSALAAARWMGRGDGMELAVAGGPSVTAAAGHAYLVEENAQGWGHWREVRS